MASTTLAEPLEWETSHLLEGDVAEAVRALKEEDGGHLHVIGSPGFVQTLIEHELVDEDRLMIDPIVLGGGKCLFRDGSVLKRLRLVESEVTTTGAIIATYAATDR